MRKPKNHICKWYNVCPINWFTKEGKLPKKWIEEYCLQANPKCVRYQMEEKGIFHPDNMLPDGTIDPSL
ncbi:MAG: uracil-DNA glycosylase [Candidatus Lokiarchaeota archaeon]|nr:uracil-DNA glycosylase [Candidatus Harpocratesius repetitus]